MRSIVTWTMEGRSRAAMLRPAKAASLSGACGGSARNRGPCCAAGNACADIGRGFEDGLGSPRLIPAKGFEIGGRRCRFVRQSGSGLLPRIPGKRNHGRRVPRIQDGVGRRLLLRPIHRSCDALWQNSLAFRRIAFAGVIGLQRRGSWPGLFDRFTKLFTRPWRFGFQCGRRRREPRRQRDLRGACRRYAKRHPGEDMEEAGHEPSASWR